MFKYIFPLGINLISSTLFAAISTPPYTSYPELSPQVGDDQQLTKAIDEKLAKGRRLKKYENVYFTVSYGNVYLQGTVETLDDKAQVTRDILSIKGVKQIDNQLTVQKMPSEYSR